VWNIRPPASRSFLGAKTILEPRASDDAFHQKAGLLGPPDQAGVGESNAPENPRSESELRAGVVQSQQFHTRSNSTDAKRLTRLAAKLVSVSEWPVI
jgi:hypothetical protein